MGDREDPRARAIAIVGMGCRFPGGANEPEVFWHNLVQGLDAIGPVPPDRWDNDAFCNPSTAAPSDTGMRWGGFVADAGLFDAAFFGISPKEAVRMDPQQRMMLEVAWEALEDAGIPADRLRGSRTGVFVGVQSQSIDYYFLQLADIGSVEFQTNTGGAHSIIANRLSYFFDLRGPSFTVDTACSSSLVALHLACQSLRAGECDLAFVGGTNLIAAPETSMAYTKLNFMAPDGRCKTFDSRANGFVRGEGCGLVLLKRASEASRDCDPVEALIRGTAVNQDGTTNGLTAPNGLSQQAVIRAALDCAGVDAAQIGYVETHGTGTILGDPIEVEALAGVLDNGTPGAEPCYLGAVKTNIGHLESAAGIAGIIKAALCLRHRFIPPNLHLQKLNPHLRLEGSRLRLPVEGSKWASRSGKRFAGVSSFGFGGTNGHAVLEEAPQEPTPGDARPAPSGDLVPDHDADLVLPISARNRNALRDVAQGWAAYLQADESQEHVMRDIARAACLRRTHLPARAAVVGRTRAQWVEGLTAILDGSTGRLPETDHAGVATGEALSVPPVVFVFSGQGAQWNAMGRELFSSEPVYRRVIERCASNIGPWNLIDELRRDESTSRLDSTEIAQPAVFSLQMALHELLGSWGVCPDLVIGHSLGEVAAACAAGVLTLEDAMKVVVHRGALMQRAAGSGRMAAVGLSADQACAELVGVEDRVVIAVLNSPGAVVLSGDADALHAVLSRVGAKGVFNRLLNGDSAFHSPAMESSAMELPRTLEGIQVHPATIPVISTVTGLPAAVTDYGPDYWGRNVRQPVRFSEAVQQALRLGGKIFVEIGPHPVLGTPLAQCIGDCENGFALPTLRRGAPERSSVLMVLATLHVAGCPVRWASFFPERGTPVRLPHYPWQHSRYWIGGRAASETRTRAAAADETRADTGPYEVKWMVKTRGVSSGSNARSTEPETPVRTGWLIVPDDGGVGLAFSQQVAARGERPVLASPGEDPAGVVHRIAASADAMSWNVVSFRALDAGGAPESLDGEDGFASGIRASCSHALKLAQAAQAAGKTGIRLWVITCGAQPVRNQDPACLQACAWGLGRTLASEMSGIWGGLVDLDPALEPSISGKALLEEILHPDDDHQVVFRGGDRLVPRLSAMDIRHAGPAAALCRGDGAYLVTGDPDGLGIHVARWLARQGARHLVVVGQSSGVPAHGGMDGAVQEIHDLGARVDVVRGDVADKGVLVAASASFGSDQPPLRGIVHAAERMEPVSASDLDDVMLAKMLHEKARGAWLLHSMFQGAALDFFIMFSSASAILASKNLSHHGAAGAFLDSLAHLRRSRGLPALSVNWGWWPEAGSSPVLDSYYPKVGLGRLSSEDAFRSLEALHRSGSAQAAVILARWEIFKPICEARGPFPFLKEINAAEPGGDEADHAEGTDFRKRLARTPVDEWRDLLAAHLRAQLSEVLGFENAGDIDEREGFFNMGMDSITALQYTSRLTQSIGHGFPATLTFEHPNLESLRQHILENILGAETAAGEKETRPAMGQRSFEGLSEQDLVDLLDARLKDLGGQT